MLSKRKKAGAAGNVAQKALKSWIYVFKK